MRTTGMLTTLVAALLVAGAVAVGVRSLPDVRRYLAIRRM